MQYLSNTTKALNNQQPKQQLAPDSNNLLDQYVQGVSDFKRAITAVEKNAPAISIALFLTSVGFVYLSRDLMFALWSLAMMALHAIAFLTLRKAAREGIDAHSLTKWNSRVIGAHWIAGLGWALLAWLECGTCTGSAFPFFKGAMVIIALSMMALGAASLPRAAWHIFMPAIITFGCVAYASREPFDVGLAASLAIIMVFIAFFNQHMVTVDKAILTTEAEKDALNLRLIESLQKAETAVADAQKANHSKSTFLASMSHDLRTPLNAILGFSEIMKDEMMGPLRNAHYREYACDINQSGRHLLDMINGVLDLSQLEAGGYRLNEEPVYLVNIIDASIAMASADATSRAIAIRCDIVSPLTPLVADARALKQILLNLISNATKFSPQGSEIYITAGCTADGGQFLAVRDNGCGMNEAELTEATKAFTRGMDTKNIEGFGLGLSIVKQLADTHQAKLLLESSPGVGTRVTLSFPENRIIETSASNVYDARSHITLPHSPEASLPFVLDSIEIENSSGTARNDGTKNAYSARNRLAAALKRQQRKAANNDARIAPKMPQLVDTYYETTEKTDFLLDAQLEAEIIDALENQRDQRILKPANAA